MSIRNKGIQFYMYRKGSVFYVDRDKAERFEQAVSNEAMEQIGYNKYHILGGNK